MGHPLDVDFSQTGFLHDPGELLRSLRSLNGSCEVRKDTVPVPRDHEPEDWQDSGGVKIVKGSENTPARPSEIHGYYGTACPNTPAHFTESGRDTGDVPSRETDRRAVKFTGPQRQVLRSSLDQIDVELLLHSFEMVVSSHQHLSCNIHAHYRVTPRCELKRYEPGPTGDIQNSSALGR